MNFSHANLGSENTPGHFQRTVESLTHSSSLHTRGKGQSTSKVHFESQSEAEKNQNVLLVLQNNL